VKYLHQILSESISLLLEYDSDKTWQQHGKKAVSRANHEREDLGNSHHVLDKMYSKPHDNEESELAVGKEHLLKHIENTDPTPNKKYVQHIARIYGNGGVNHIEDLHSRMKPALGEFDDLVKRKKIPAEHRDIGRIKSLSQLEDLNDAHRDVMSGKEENKAHHEKMKSESSIEDHGTFTKIIPHTKEAAQHFGKGTKWCTATKDINHSMFDHYNKDGPMHIMIPHHPQYDGEKYQYHRSSNQLMNEKDKSVKRSDLPHEMKHHLDLYDQHVEHAKNNPEIAKNHLERDVKDHYMIHHAPKGEIDHITNNMLHQSLGAAMSSKHVHSNDLNNFLNIDSEDHAYDNEEKHPDYISKDEFSRRNMHITDEYELDDEYDYHRRELLSKIQSDMDMHQSTAAKNSPNMTSDIAKNLLNSNIAVYHAKDAIANKHVNADGLHDIISHYENNIHNKIESHTSAHALNKLVDGVRNNPNHDESHGDRLAKPLKDLDSHALGLINNLKMSKVSLDSLIDSKSPSIVGGVISNPNSDKSHTEIALKHDYEGVRIMARMKIAGKDISNKTARLVEAYKKSHAAYTDAAWPHHPQNPENKK
jgi:hypothetical protein